MDTPRDVPARTRFARYRGLRSLRTSPWDPYENLPHEYARIFEFEEFKRTERDVSRAAEIEGVEVRPVHSPSHLDNTQHAIAWNESYGVLGGRSERGQ